MSDGLLPNIWFGIVAFESVSISCLTAQISVSACSHCSGDASMRMR